MDVPRSEISRAAILPLFPEIGREINYTTAAVYGAIVYLAMMTGQDSVIVNRGDLANLIGVRRDWLRKCMSRLVDEGWLERKSADEWRPLRWKRM